MVVVVMTKGVQGRCEVGKDSLINWMIDWSGVNVWKECVKRKKWKVYSSETGGSRLRWRLKDKRKGQSEWDGQIFEDQGFWKYFTQLFQLFNKMWLVEFMCS